MTIFNLIPVSLIGTGIFLEFISYNEKNKLKNKISNEKIYLFPLELNLITSENNTCDKINHTNFIVKIDKNEVNKIIENNIIGYVGINGIVKIPKIVHKNVYNSFLNELQTEKQIEYQDIKKKLGFQILFPNFHDKLILNPKLLMDNKIKILLNNKLFTNSNNKRNIIEEYEELVRKNIPNFKSDLYLDFANSIELEKNILKQNSDLFLIVTNAKTNNYSENYDNKLEINAMSNCEQIIINEKYKNNIGCINGLDVLSVSLIGIGIIFGISACKFN